MTETSLTVYAAGGAALVAIGFYDLMARRHLLRRILALNVMSSGVFLVLITIAARTPGPVPDPIPHAMVLTGIVVSVCATALALTLAGRVQDATGRPELDPYPEGEPPDAGTLPTPPPCQKEAR